ncbi:MAG: type II secretion system F family protein [Gemmatimonadota bacterium]
MLVLVALLAAASVVFMIVAVAGAVPARSRAVTRRLAELQTIASRHTVTQRRRRQARREQLETWLQAFGERVASGRTDWLQVRQRLVRAGYRRSNAVAIFFGARVVSVVAVGALIILLVPVLGLRPSELPIWVGLGAIVGWMLPGTLLSRRIRHRQKELQRALADALDLLVVCVEAGLGLNQAILRVSEEIEHISESMAEELAIVNLEIRAGTPREEALRHLGERTDVPDIRSLTAMLIQTDRFGTSIAQALRVHSDTMRVKRRQRAEEAAAKTTIKLVFPLVLFIFPAMFVVILGPAIIHILAELGGLT